MVTGVPIYFKHRQLVLPGELLAEGNYVPSGAAYAEGNKIYASAVGLAELREKNIVHVISLSSVYTPRVGDVVVGKVIEIGLTGWYVDINAPYLAFLPVSEATTRFVDIAKENLANILNRGDVVVAKVLIADVTRENLVISIKEGGKLGRKREGTLIEIDPAKVPRVIGRKGTMINLIKSSLECDIIVGQNGWILIQGKSLEDELFVARLIKKIERESHVPGLTERIRKLIEEYLAQKKKE
ncbi:MAG: RNA-binding protein [Thermoprotei archaeon]|nr:MAG: RNA-binding protein [Thermoprotei archaeon]